MLRAVPDASSFDPWSGTTICPSLVGCAIITCEPFCLTTYHPSRFSLRNSSLHFIIDRYHTAKGKQLFTFRKKATLLRDLNS